MAEVRITIGPVAGIVTIDNAVAEKYARLYAAALAVSGTPSAAQKLDAVAQGAVTHIHQRALRRALDDAVRQAQTDFETGE